jgi:hypothetical protein
MKMAVFRAVAPCGLVKVYHKLKWYQFTTVYPTYTSPHGSTTLKTAILAFLFVYGHTVQSRNYESQHWITSRCITSLELICSAQQIQT